MLVTDEYEEKVSEMCNLSVGVREKGREEGRVETLVSAVRDMNETLGLTPDATLDALHVTGEERARILQRLAVEG